MPKSSSPVLWSVVVLVVGCGDDSQPRSDNPGTDCVADPIVRMVCSVDETNCCENDAHCPAGTVCMTIPGEMAGGSGGTTGDSGVRTGDSEGTTGGSEELVRTQCRPPQGPRTASDALIDGFGVRQMLSTLSIVELPASGGDVKESAEMSWSAPAGVELVTCALFVCPPVIDFNPDRGVVEIINYDTCVVARTASTNREGAFSLTDPDVRYPDPDPDPATRDPASAARTLDVLVPRRPSADLCSGELEYDTNDRYPMTELLVGCWAYDSTRLVAATRLRRPAAAQIFDFHDNLDLDCAATDGVPRACVLANGTFGTCIDNECRQRCVVHDDCNDEEDASRLDVCEPLETGEAGGTGETGQTVHGFRFCAEKEPERLLPTRECLGPSIESVREGHGCP